MAEERSLVLVKPDGVARGLTGEILGRFERAGLVIERLKLTKATDELIDRHYPNDKVWLESVGNKTREAYQKEGLSLSASFGSEDPERIGRVVKSWLASYMTSGPIVAVVLKGNRAVENVRRLVGNTFPNQSAPGTIRGDFSVDSPDQANREGRSIRNLVHASGNTAEAEHEIALWFGQAGATLRIDS